MFHRQWFHQGGFAAVSVLLAVFIVSVCPDALAQTARESSTDTVLCGCSFRDTVNTSSGQPVVVLPITLEPHKYPQDLVSNLLINGKSFKYLSCRVSDCSDFTATVDSIPIVNGLQMLVLSVDFTNAKWGEKGDEYPPQQIVVELRFVALTGETSISAGMPKLDFEMPCSYALLIFGNEYGEAVIKNCNSE